MNQHPQYSDEELAGAWIRRHSQNRKKVLLIDAAETQMRDEQRIDVETEWAIHELGKLVNSDAAHAWAVILRILDLAQEDESILDNLAAGPLESLLAHHGRDVLKWVEAEAVANPRFKELLRGVWRNAIDETVWKQIQLLSSMPTDPKAS